MCKGNTTDFPLKGVEVTEEGGIWNVKEGQMMSRTWEYLKFSTPYFLTLYRNFNNSGFSWQAEAISRGLLCNPVIYILLQHFAAYITDCIVRTL